MRGKRSLSQALQSGFTGIVRFQPGPGIFIEERLVVVDDGRELGRQ